MITLLKIAGLEYWFQLLFNWMYAKCSSGKIGLVYSLLLKLFRTFWRFT